MSALLGATNGGLRRSVLSVGIDPGKTIGVAILLYRGEEAAPDGSWPTLERARCVGVGPHLMAVHAFESDGEGEAGAINWIAGTVQRLLLHFNARVRVFVESVCPHKDPNPKLINRARMECSMATGLILAERVARTLELSVTYPLVHVANAEVVAVERVRAPEGRGAIIGAPNASNARIRATLDAMGFGRAVKHLEDPPPRGLNEHTRDAIVAALYGTARARLRAAGLGVL